MPLTFTLPDPLGAALAENSGAAGKSTASQESIVPTVIAACHYHNISMLTQAKARTQGTQCCPTHFLQISPPSSHKACMCGLVSFSVADMNF